MAKFSFPTGDAAEQIATALSILSGQPVSKDQVVVEPTDDAGRYLITVYETAAIAAKVIKYMDEYGSIPTTMGELCPVGHRTNHKLCKMDLRQHGQIIGGTTSGKSSLIHIMLAHATRCTDCFIWIGGVWKLYDFVMAYVERYINVCHDCGVKHLPPIDWIAHGQQDVCNMMAAFMQIAKYRMNLRNNQRGGLPCGILVLDEVTFITDDKFTKGYVNGKPMNASDMIAGIARGTASAKLYEWLATQHDTMTNFGDQGATTISQMMFSFVFAIRSQGSVGRVLDDYSLPTPRKRGECWADLGLDNPIFKLRIPYPQTPDIGKPVLHDGPKLDEIMWNRRHIPHVMDPGSANAAGEHYANRFRMVDDEYIDYLTRDDDAQGIEDGINRATAGGVPLNGGYLPDLSIAEEQEAEREFYRLVNSKASQNGNGLREEWEKGKTDERVSSVPVQYKNRADRVMAIIFTNDIDGGSPMGRGEIIDKLVGMGDDVKNPRVVSNLLNDLVNADPPRLVRTEDDKYYSL